MNIGETLRTSTGRFAITNIQDRVRLIAILENSEELLESLKAKLIVAGFCVLTPASEKDCLDLAASECEYFVLDVDMGLGRETEGFLALELLKAKYPNAYCAIMTSHPDRSYVESVAKRLGADFISGKSDEDLALLFDRIERDYLRRFLGIEPLNFGAEAVSIAGLVLRSSPPIPVSFLELQKECPRLDDIGRCLREKDITGALSSMVLLEPSLIQALERSNAQGGEAVAIGALLNAILNETGEGLSTRKWSLWASAFKELSLSRGPISLKRASNLAKELDEAGFDTEPPGYELLTRIFPE